jgi:uncharacterized membrane protein
MRWGLYASLALNLVLVGAVAGALAAGVRLDRPHGPPPFERGADEGGRAELMHKLGPEQRELLRRTARQGFEATADLRVTARDARQRLVALAAAPTFDRAAIEAQLAQVRRLDGEVAAAFSGALLDAMAAMSPADRAAVARTLFIRRMGLGAVGEEGRGPLAGPPPPALSPQAPAPDVRPEAITPAEPGTP